MVERVLRISTRKLGKDVPRRGGWTADSPREIQTDEGPEYELRVTHYCLPDYKGSQEISPEEAEGFMPELVAL